MRCLLSRQRAAGLVVLVAAAGCGGAKTSDNPAGGVVPAGAPQLDLSSKPQLLFQVFGEKVEPKMMPIAAVVGGSIKPIGLTKAGWRQLDSMYFAAGAKYPIYIDDLEEGSATVTRGMWSGQDEATYPLPGCKDLRPLAGVTVELTRPTTDPTVELIASSSPLAKHLPFAGTLPASEEVARLGKALGLTVTKAKGMDAEELDSLDFTARMIVTGASKSPTLLVSFIDPQAGDLGPGQGHTTNVLALADRSDTTYLPTYRHVESGEAKTVEFQRLVDHLDADGDGIDELILESWHYGGENELVVLSFKAGAWHEVLRSRQTWCLDPPRAGSENKKP